MKANTDSLRYNRAVIVGDKTITDVKYLIKKETCVACKTFLQSLLNKENKYVTAKARLCGHCENIWAIEVTKKWIKESK